MTGTRPHQLVWFAARLHDVLDEVGAGSVWSLTPVEHRGLLVDLARAQARLEALRLSVLASADTVDVAADTAASSTAAWVAHATRLERRAASGDLRLATALASGQFAPTATALAAGRLAAGQARVIVAAVTALPATVDPGDRDRCQRHLVTLAADHDAAALKVLGRRVWEVIDPATAEEAEGRRLDAEERAAARASYLWVRDNGDGTHTGRFTIPSLHATALTRLLAAFTNPRHTHATKRPTGTDPTPGSDPLAADPTQHPATDAQDPNRHPATDAEDPNRHPATDAEDPNRHPATDAEDLGRQLWRQAREETDRGTPDLQTPVHDDPDIDPPGQAAEQQVGQAAEQQPGEHSPTSARARATTPERLGEAFCELLTRIPARWVPKLGGMSPRIVVKLDYHQLLTGLGTATLDTGHPISAALARRLACESGIIPAVLAHPLGSESVLLDLGAEARFHNHHQRLARTITHGAGCAADGCDRHALHAHHQISWAHGGDTDHTNQILLCPYHHGITHSPDYHTTHLPDGRLHFHRRT